MAEKVATAEIYTDMVAAGDICKVVKNGSDYKIYVFDRNKYIQYNPKMTFEESYKYLDAIYAAIYTINKNSISAPMLRNHAVQVVLHHANRVFRKEYSRGYEKNKNTDVVDTILSVMSRSDRLGLTRDMEKADRDCEATKFSLENAIKNSNIAAVSQSEFYALKAKYDHEIQVNGAKPIKR